MAIHHFVRKLHLMDIIEEKTSEALLSWRWCEKTGGEIRSQGGADQSMAIK